MTNKKLSDMRGFSHRNLKYMRAFAAVWPDWTMVQQLAAQIPVVFDDPLKHDFYVETCGVEGWSDR